MFTMEGPVVIIRQEDQGYDKETGNPNPDIEVEITIQGNLQPSTGEDLQKLEDGYRLEDVMVLFSHEELKEGDLISYKGELLGIEKDQSWDPLFSPIPHYRYLAVKEVNRTS